MESLYFSGKLPPLKPVNGGVIERSQVKVTKNENVKLVFRAYLSQKRMDLRRINNEMIISPCYEHHTFHQ